MKILCPRAYYDPEQTAGAHLMQDLEDCFTQRHTIEYLVSTPTRGVSEDVREQYKHRLREEKKDGKVQIRRFPMFREGKSSILRAIRYLLCNIAQIYYGKKENDIDVIYSGSTPPTIGLVCIRISKGLQRKQKKEVPVIYKLDDVFPDSLVQAGMTHERSLIWKFGRKIENYVYSNVHTIIVNSDGMRDNLLAKDVPEKKIKIVNNWIDFDAVKPISKDDNPLFQELCIPREKFIVLYAGNFGEAQGAGIILEVAKRALEYEDIHFVVFGGGARFAEFREQTESISNLQVFDLLPLSRVSEVYSLADVALITCKQGFGGIGMPSKTWSIMACNKPIIASYDINSDLNSIIEKCQAGHIVAPGDADALSIAIRQQFIHRNDSKEDLKIREAAMKIASKEYCVNEILRAIEAAVV